MAFLRTWSFLFIGLNLQSWDLFLQHWRLFPEYQFSLSFGAVRSYFYFLSFFRSHHFVVNVLSLALLSILRDAGYLLSLLIIFLMLIVRNMGFPILFLYASVPFNHCLWKMFKSGLSSFSSFYPLMVTCSLLCNALKLVSFLLLLFISYPSSNKIRLLQG